MQSQTTTLGAILGGPRGPCVAIFPSRREPGEVTAVHGWGLCPSSANEPSEEATEAEELISTSVAQEWLLLNNDQHPQAPMQLVQRWYMHAGWLFSDPAIQRPGPHPAQQTDMATVCDAVKSTTRICVAQSSCTLHDPSIADPAA